MREKRERVILPFLHPFSTNAPLMDKPGSSFSPVKYLKNTCGRVTSKVKMQVFDLHLRTPAF